MWLVECFPVGKPVCCLLPPNPAEQKQPQNAVCLACQRRTQEDVPCTSSDGTAAEEVTVPYLQFNAQLCPKECEAHSRVPRPGQAAA